MTELLFIVIGLAIGVVVGLLVEKSKSSAMAAKYELKQQELTNSEARMQQEMENRLAMQKAHYEEVMTTKEQASRQAQEEQEKRHQEAVDAMKLRFQETMDKVTAQVKTATDSMLKERQKEFAENSNQSLGQIVNPLRETIEKMKKAMDENTEKQTSMSGEMKANIENMMRQSMAAKESADTNGIHYDTQATIKDALGHTVKSDDGSMLRPDVILHLDQRRELIIDSKVSLTAFMDYVNADNEDDRQRFLKAHIDSLQKHVKELSAKDYSSYIQPPKVKMDYVIMFVPHTGALWTALNAQPDMWRKAMEKNVFIADEQTLFAALRIINLTWTQIVQAQNHEKVYALANEMLNRVGQFWKEYDAMGKALKRLNEAYDDGRKKITEGGQSINTTANQLIKLGAKQSDKNPLPQLMDIDDIAGIPADLS